MLHTGNYESLFSIFIQEELFFRDNGEEEEEEEEAWNNCYRDSNIFFPKIANKKLRNKNVFYKV